MCVLVSQPMFGPVQSALVLHCAQVPIIAPVVTHTGVAVRCAHCVLIVHGWQVCEGSQNAASAAVHCIESTQATHVWLPIVSQWGVLPEQSPSARQPTQVSLVPDTRQCGVAPEHVPLQATCASTGPVSVPMSTGGPLSATWQIGSDGVERQSTVRPVQATQPSASEAMRILVRIGFSSLRIEG
jgi:hypothetical protein